MFFIPFYTMMDICVPLLELFFSSSTLFPLMLTFFARVEFVPYYNYSS